MIYTKVNRAELPWSIARPFVDTSLPCFSEMYQKMVANNTDKGGRSADREDSSEKWAELHDVSKNISCRAEDHTICVRRQALTQEL